MTLTQRLAATAATALLAASLTACGGDGGDRPSVDEISESIQDGGMLGGEGVDAAAADCIAEAFHESDLSDDALRAIVEQDEDYDASSEDEEAIESLQTDEMMECMTDSMDLPDPEDPEAS